MKRLLVLLALLVCVNVQALAVEPDEVLKDPALEARARDISASLRCLVCQNQSIDDSSAPLARDLRLIVRERLVAGDSDEEVEAFVVARYGEFVLLRPPFNRTTVLLWLGPWGLLLGAAALIWLRRRSQTRPAAEPPLSPEEQARLEALLRKEEG